jgi:hypothetical protein
VLEEDADPVAVRVHEVEVLLGALRVRPCGQANARRVQHLADVAARLVVADERMQPRVDPQPGQVHRLAGTGAADAEPAPGRVERGEIGRQRGHLDQQVPRDASDDGRGRPALGLGGGCHTA